MDNEDKINRLKELIQRSASFNDEDKKKLIAKIPELKPEEIDKAIRIFEEEIEDWKAIYKKHEEDKALLLDFMDKSHHEIAQMSKKLIKESEKGEHKVEEAEAEDLLKTIE